MPVYINYQFCGWLSSFCGGYSLYVGARVPFRGSFGICGRDKSVPYGCEQIAITLRTDCDNAWRTFREIHTLNHEIHNGHSVRRRGRFIVPVYICYHFCGWLSSFCGGFSLYVGVFVYAGAINRPLRLRTDCDNAADGLR